MTLNNLILFCKNNSLGFVPVNYDSTNKKKYCPFESGYKDFDFKKSLEIVINKGEGDGLFINIKNKFLVVDTDDLVSYKIFTEEVFPVLGIKPYITKSFSNIRGNKTYKNHFWFKVNKFYPKIIKFKNLECDIITDIIAEEKTTSINWEEIPLIHPKLLNLFYDKREIEIKKVETKKDYKITDNQILDLLNILKKERKDNFKDWSLVGLILKNISDDLLGIYNDWSKESSKYKGFSDIKKYWESFKMKEDGLKIGTLRFWANLDHPILYNKWFNKYFTIEAEFINEEETENLYSQMKANFNGFKILNPLCFCYILDDEIVINKKQSFKDTFENKTIKSQITLKSGKIKMKKKSFIEEWLKDEDIKCFNKMDFLPKALNIPENIFNTFTGFEIEKKPPTIIGDLVKSKIWEHLFNLSCRDEKIFNYMLKWLALRIQSPSSVQNNTGIVIKGAEGTGKNLFFDWFGSKIIGRKYYGCVQKIDNLFGQFNSLLNDKILLVVNELDSKAFKYTEEIKDSLVAETLTIQRKGFDSFTITNNTGFIFITNNFNVLNISEKDRRFVLLDIGDKNAQNVDYFKPLIEEMNSGKYDFEFYNYLLNLDIKGYDFQKERPITEYYKEIQTLSRPVIIDFLIDLYENNINNKEIKQKSSNFFDNFNIFIDNGGFNYKLTQTKFSILIKKYDFIEYRRTSKGIYYFINIEKLKSYLISKNYIDNIEFQD